MQRVTVTGGWVEYREPEDVPERLRRRVTMLASQAPAQAANQESNLTESDMEFFMAFNDAVALCLVVAWSWDEPVSLDGLQNLPGRVYDEIVKYTQGLMDRLLPSFAVDPNPKALTEN